MTRLPILLLGFEPFGDFAINPSAVLATTLEGEWIGDARVHTAIMPVDSERIGPVVQKLLRETRFSVVLALGLAAGRAALNVERVAVNVRDFAIADNAGNQIAGEPIVPDGPNAYLATVTASALVAAIRDAGVPACLSNTAGTYLCNQLLYLLCHVAATKAEPRPRCGFIHLPCLPEQAAQMAAALGSEGQPSMSLATMLTGVRAALHAAIETV
jgi:pyroglutamyl-peptidase